MMKGMSMFGGLLLVDEVLGRKGCEEAVASGFTGVAVMVVVVVLMVADWLLRLRLYCFGYMDACMVGWQYCSECEGVFSDCIML